MPIVRGGLYLLLGVDGQVKIVTEVTQWAVVEAGLKGDTFLGAPVTQLPVFNILDIGCDIDVTNVAPASIYLKAGPMIGLEILGWDVAGAGLFLGLGLENIQQATYINTNAYLLLEAYADLLGNSNSPGTGGGITGIDSGMNITN